MRGETALASVRHGRSLLIRHNVDARAPRFDLARGLRKLLLILARPGTDPFKNRFDLFLMSDL
jgi:hypothetical protein